MRFKKQTPNPNLITLTIDQYSTAIENAARYNERYIKNELLEIIHREAMTATQENNYTKAIHYYELLSTLRESNHN